MTTSLRLLSIAVLLMVAACGDKSPRKLAELVSVASGNAAVSTNQSTWQPAPKGTAFYEGNAVRTDEEGVAQLSFLGQLLQMGPSTTVYFGVKKLDFEGELELSDDLSLLDLDFGTLEVAPDGRVRLRKRGDEVRFELLLGSMSYTRDGETTELAVGDTFVFQLGETTFERVETSIDAGVDAGSLVAGAGSSSLDPIEVRVSGKAIKATGADGKSTSLSKGSHPLSVPTSLVLKSGSTATLTRGADQATVKGPANISIDPGGPSLLTLDRGRGQVIAKEALIRVAIPGGTLQVYPSPVDGYVDVDVDNKGADAEVSAGRATLGNDAGESRDLQVGEVGSLSAAGALEVQGEAPTVANLTLPISSEVLTIYDAEGPTDLRVDFSKFCERGVVELARGKNFRRASQRRAGAGDAILRLSSGMNRYRVRCYVDGQLQEEAAATGSAILQKDSGAQPLPRRAQKNEVETDGRNYSVLYQNRPPSIRFSWPDAPKAASYELHLKPEKGPTTKQSISGPETTIPSGGLQEGNYVFWIQSPSKSSPKSRLAIRFDNVAPSGYISRPRAKADVKGDQVRVTGATVLGWSVSIAGQSLRLDGQQRFDQQVPVSKDGSIAVRFSHPKHGVHLYLRK